MGALALAAVGIGLGAAGTSMQASSAKSKRAELKQAFTSWLPDLSGDQAQYFDDLTKYQPRAAELSRQIGEDDLAAVMALREKAMPGITSATQKAFGAAAPMAAGEIPSWLQ